jgi:hypothetical protein
MSDQNLTHSLDTRAPEPDCMVSVLDAYDARASAHTGVVDSDSVAMQLLR